MPYIYHGFVNPQADSADTAIARPSDWNAALQYGDNGPSGTIAIVRLVLTGDTTYHVSTLGSDVTGDGTSGNPWATIQHAVDYIGQSVDVSGYVVTIQLTPGTVVTPNVYAGATLPPLTGGGHLHIETSDDDTAKTTISQTGSPIFVVNHDSTTDYGVGGMTLESDYPVVDISANVTFHLGTTNCANVKLVPTGGRTIIDVSDHGSFSDCEYTSNITIAPTVPTYSYINATGKAFVSLNVTTSPAVYTISGNPTWTGGFLSAAFGAEIVANLKVGVNVSGASTGPRLYVVNSFLVLNQLVSDLPGNADGTRINSPTYVAITNTYDMGLAITNTFESPAVAFASLPSSPVAGMISTINNSSVSTFGAVIGGTGATTVLGWYNGTNWTVIGA